MLANAREQETATAQRDRNRIRLADYEVRATTTGTIAETTSLNPGVWLEQGAHVATIVPRGKIRVHARFKPKDALGRVVAGQPAVLRFPGFPWLRYGSRDAVVTHVSGEIRDGFLEVSLTPTDEGPGLEIPLTHGLPCTVEIEVDRVTPWTLFLRKLGKTLDRRATQ